jgi:hypothetical protein
MGVPFQNPEPMTAEEFFAFTATRPDEEKWELIDGQPIMNASASFLHQLIVKNLVIEMARLEAAASYGRSDGFLERRFERLDLALDVPAIGISLPLAKIYANIELS